MKHVKKLLAVVLSAALAMAMCVSAFADEALKTITITNNDNGNTYSVYQVFDENGVTAAFSDFFGPNKQYNIDNGYVVKNNTDPVLKFGQTENTESDTRDTNNNKTETAILAQALAQYARNADPAIATTATITDTTATSVPNGWYLIDETESKGEKDNNGASEVASKPMLIDLISLNSAEVAPKNEYVNLDKVIIDDKKEVETNSAQIGDPINYKVTTITPKYEANVNVNALKFILTDEFSDGLSYVATKEDGSSGMVVKADGVTLTEGEQYDVIVQDQTVKVWFKRSWLVANQATPITLEYQAILNGQAKVNDMDGNPNTIKLNYSNNPGQVKDSDVENNEDLPENPDDDDDNPDTDNKIPTKELEDNVKTFTYGIDIIKVDGHENKDLPGAEFELTDEDGNKVQFVKTTDDTTGDDIYRVATPEEIAAGGTTTTVTSKNGGKKAIIEGLDAGTYSLEETKAPDEYTKLAEPVNITITEKTGDIEKTVTVTEYDENGNVTDRHEETTTVTGPTGNVTYSVDNVAVTELGEDGLPDTSKKTGETSAEGGSIQMNVYVPNEKGVTMPETGSRTAMYCMIGGAVVIVLGAGYYLMGARRNKKEQ